MLTPIRKGEIEILNMKLLMIGAPEIIFIVLIVLLLFGGKKIPELMKGLGKGVRSFKEGMSEVEEEIKKPLDNTQPNPSQTQSNGQAGNAQLNGQTTNAQQGGQANAQPGATADDAQQAQDTTTNGQPQ